MSNDNHPLLGEPCLVGGKVYRIKEKGVIGKTYAIACAHCGQTFAVTPKQMKGNIEKCPACKAVYGFNAKSATTNPSADNKAAKEEVSQVTGKLQLLKAQKSLGVLEWGGFIFKKTAPLHLGANTIGRKDDEELSDISINDEYMSRRSVCINVEKDTNQKGYKFKLTVNRASNPIIVGSHSLMVGNSIYLNYGDTIKMGHTVITFKEGKS